MQLSRSGNADRSVSIETLPDASIASRALHDPAAFGILFDRHWNEVFKFCYYRLGNWHQAEDAASQVFIDALNSLPNFDHRNRDDSFRCWLFGIAKHVVGSSHRYARRHSTSPLEAAIAVEDETVSPEEQAVAAEELWQLRMLLQRLTSEQRELIELRLAGLTSTEIARLLGRSHDAVRKSQSRILQSLREAAEQLPQVSNGSRHV